MAPSKRTRPLEDDGDSEIVSVESAQSSLRQDARKKARTSDPLSHSKSRTVRTDADSEDGSVEEGSGSYERRRDAGFKDLEDEDLDTQRATQIIQRRNQMSMDNLPAENGVIEAVTCINFMCHSKLHVSFGPLINFVIGHNGSGKSAVLTALTLCLGGKAVSTNRGQSLKSFIKEGQESASLIVKIKNTGSNGYQRETFGDSIIVERHFSKAGASGFKIKGSNGRVISTKKADLEEISDFFAFQIDNPMNILTQDMARQFLNNSTPADKYKFFVKGVQLEQLDQDYRLLEDFIDQSENKLAARSEDIDALKRIAREAREKLALSEKHSSLRDTIRSCRRQMAWAQVEEQERALNKVEEDIFEANLRIERAESDATSYERKFDDASLYATQMGETLQEVTEGLLPLQDNRKQIKEQFDKNKSDLIARHAEERTITNHLKEAQRKVSKTKVDIKAEHDRRAAVNGGIHATKLLEIENAKENSAEAKARLVSHTEAGSSLEEQAGAAERDSQRMSSPLENKRAEVKQCENQLQTLLRDRGQQQGAFHENMPSLLRAIRDHPGFRETPVGPVGNHVRLLKPVWSSVLERSFGATLNSFIVTSKQDQALLSNLMRKVSCNCPILIGNNQPINTSNNEPDSHFDTSLRVLEIDNDLVRRQLVINQGIEQTILIENREEANHVMFDGAKPRNVKQCFCLHDSKRGWGVRLAFTRGVEASTSPIMAMNGRPRMKTDVESQISFQRESLQQLKRELNELEQSKRDWESKIRTCQQAIVRHKRQRRDLHLEHQRAEDLVAKLQDELDQDTVEDGRLEALNAVLKEAEEESETYGGSYQDSITAKDKMNETAKRLKKELNDVDEQLAEYDAKVKKAESKRLKAANLRQAALQEKNAAFQVIDDAKLDKERVVRSREAAAQRVSDFIGKATQVCERVPIEHGESIQSLDKKYEKLSRDLDRYQRELGDSRESIARRAKDTHITYEKAKKQIKSLERLIYILKLALSERMDRWRKFRRLISARARSNFMYLLSERSFRGILKTDHQKHVLDLHVEPDETRRGKGRQTKTLSGGEKSFSTICLLLALWEAMGSPIRCLDEFDVFMDNVNRDVSLKMMINAARRSVGRQFILITPQSMGNVDVAGDVKIIKLSDPERGGQTTLPFSNR